MEREEKRKLLRARTVYESKMANVDGMDSDLVVFVVTDRTNIDVYDGPVEHRVVVVSRGGFRRRRKRFDVCARVAHSRLVLELRIVRGSWGVLLTMFNYGHKQVSWGVFAALSALYWGWVAFVMWYDDQCKKKANI